MKLLINLLFMVGMLVGFSTEVYAEQCNVGAFAQSDGTIKQKPVCFINVKNVSGQSLSSGAVVVADLTGDDGVQVTTASSAGQKAVCVLMGTIADDGFGRCQTYGYHSGVQFAGSVAAGTVGTDESATAGQDIYVTEHFAGKVQGLSGNALAAITVTVGASTPRGVGSIGVFLDSSTTTETVEAFIDLR
jgi:hypothetical protein